MAKRGLTSHFVALFKGINENGIWQQLQELPNLIENKIDGTVVSSPNKLLMQVLAAKVNRPELKTIQHEKINFYPQLSENEERRLIPLEVVFRFGIVEGSSLIKRLESNPGYAASLGLKTIPPINQWFPQPVVEFTTKLEAKDRHLTWQEAALLANLSAQQFENLVELASDIALVLHVLFAEKDLELWDGKLEFVFEGNSETGEILLADSVGPDELRLLYKGVHLSKEVLRQYYRPSAWAQSVPKAQSMAKENREANWREICRQQLDQNPDHIAPDMKKLVDQLYGVITNQLLDYPVYANYPKLNEFASALKETLAHYRREKINA